MNVIKRVGIIHDGQTNKKIYMYACRFHGVSTGSRVKVKNRRGESWGTVVVDDGYIPEFEAYKYADVIATETTKKGEKSMEMHKGFVEGDEVIVKLTNNTYADGVYQCHVKAFEGPGAIVRVELQGRQNAIHVPYSAIELVNPRFEIGDRVKSRLGSGEFIVVAFETHPIERVIVRSIFNSIGDRKRYAYLPKELIRDSHEW